MTTALVIPRDPPGRNNFHQVPIGALYTAQRLRAQGEDVAFYDLRLDEREEHFAQIASADLSVVFSTDYDLAQCYPSLEPAARCIRMLKEAGASLTACAGSHATVDAEMTREFTGADAVITGEFEFAIPELVQRMTTSTGEKLGARWPAEGARLAHEAELAGLDTPAYDLAPMRRYFSEGFVDDALDRVNSGLVLGNRGCPYACSFCYLFFGRRLRRRPVSATLVELETLHRIHGISHFFFLDYTFTLDKGWVHELCEGIERLGLPISWVCQTRVDCLDEETLRAMRRAGCDGVWLGVESPMLEQRRYLSKGRIGFAQIEAGVAAVRAAGINVLAFVMVGLPTESVQSLTALNAWLSESEVYYSLSTFQRRLGTPLAEQNVPAENWSYLDVDDGRLGESELAVADLEWFFQYHENSEHRVANIMRQRLSAG